MDVLIGLGANLGNPPRSFRGVLEDLAERHRVVAVSSLYRSRPVGPPQDDFFNMAAVLQLRNDPMELLGQCQRLELDAGRNRELEQRLGPRPLDIDLLIASGVVHLGPRLVLPHPRLHERAFALVPAAEIVPAWIHPMNGLAIAELADAAVRRDPEAVWRVED